MMTEAGRERAPTAAGTADAWRRWWTAVMYIAAVALVLRFYDLPRKPLHHDEGVNGLFLTALARPPHVYRYDPANYHGPTLYYAAWLSTTLLPAPTVAIRFVTGLAGWLSVLLILGCRRRLGNVGAVTAAALLAVSPGAVYFSRYFIHEALLVCSTMALVVAAVYWLDSRRSLGLHLAALAAGLLFATKETAIITAVVLTAAAVSATWAVPSVTTSTLAGWRAPSDSPPSRWRVRAVADAITSCVDPHGRGGRQAIDWLLALLMFVAVNVLFYTSLFTHPAGALDALRALVPWMQAGTSTHTHPWYMYAVWLWQEEWPILLAGAAGIVMALWRADRRFAVFVAMWALGMMAGYSAIPYKTPWLALNMIAPLALAGGYAADVLWSRRPSLPRPALAIAGGALLAAAAWQAVVLSFFRYDDERRAYVYVHTDRDILALVAQVDRLRAENGAVTVAVMSDSHFPLSWYLRDYRAGFHGRPVETKDSVVIASMRQHENVVPLLGDRYVNLGSYRLRPGVDLQLFGRSDLKGLASARRSGVGGLRRP